MFKLASALLLLLHVCAAVADCPAYSDLALCAESTPMTIPVPNEQGCLPCRIRTSGCGAIISSQVCVCVRCTLGICSLLPLITMNTLRNLAESPSVPCHCGDRPRMHRGNQTDIQRHWLLQHRLQMSSGKECTDSSQLSHLQACS